MLASKSDILDRLAFADLSSCGSRPALRLRIGPTREHRDVSFAELGRMVRGSAGALAARGCEPGQRVALLLPHTHRLVGLFFGAIYAGLVPSIVAWPTARMDREKYRRNLLAIVAGLDADVLITEPDMARSLGAALGATRVVDIGDLELLLKGGAPAGGAEPAPRIGSGDPLFIQFSGGTTGAQKSVPIALAHLHAQLQSYTQVLGLTEDDAIVSWLPLYHDMGLIACQVMPFLYRLPVTMLAPMEWILDPGRLLRAAGADRSTLCWLPNFGYSFMASKARLPEPGPDLSSLRGVINCSEPVRAESMERFVERFAPYGLRRTAVHTCYAMAEATFAVTQSTDADPPRWVTVSREAFGRGQIEPTPAGERTLVSCGPLISGVLARIAGPDGEQLGDGAIGEIWLRGDFIMDGYLGPRDSAAPARWAFTSDGWYRTGDLGALLDGHLFVTARKKDVIIIGGVNIYPEDLEARVSEVDGVHPGRAVALGLDDPELGTERLVVVAEVNEADDRDHGEIDAEIRRAVVAVCGVAPYRVFVVPPKWIVKSTAGKISRIETRNRVRERWQKLEG